jgi:uncharacterized protein YjlB
MGTKPANYLKRPNVSTHIFADDGAIPNNRDLELIVYGSALELPEHDAPGFIETVLKSHNWAGTWRNGIYTYHHYHSTAHEVLVVYCGAATVQFGGEKGAVVELKSGDAVVIPAGVGHKNLGSSADFAVVGAYPQGQDPDLLRGERSERPRADENIKQVPQPSADPLYGSTGPLLEHWREVN